MLFNGHFIAQFLFGDLINEG